MTTLLYSLVLMVGLFLLLYAAIALVQDNRFFSTAPPDILAVVQPREKERFPGARALGWGLLTIASILLKGPFLLAGLDGLRRGFTWGQLFGRFLLMMLLLKAFDILFFDWFLLGHSRFFQHYYPETEGCAGYHSFGYNWKSHVRHCIWFFPLSAVLAWAFIAIAR